MRKLSVEQVLNLHKIMVETTGGSHGVRDIALIESAVHQIDQTFGGVELYPELEQKSARLAYSLISNHGFIDGNKRIGILVMLVFLEINNVKLKFTQQELIDFGLGTASGLYKFDEILDFVQKHK